VDIPGVVNRPRRRAVAKAQSLSIPHYGLGVSFVLSHLAAGACVLMLSHGVARLYADRS
jgi:hypothetical protein